MTVHPLAFWFQGIFSFYAYSTMHDVCAQHAQTTLNCWLECDIGSIYALKRCSSCLVSLVQEVMLASEWAFSAQFFIVSGPSGAGKTTFLEHCLSKMQEKGLRVGGLLAPTVDGRRRLQLLGSAELLRFQLNDGTPGDGSGQSSSTEIVDGVQVGNFCFDRDTFAAARSELHGLRELQSADWILIDEVGPLEFRGEGLEPALGDLLRAASRGELGPPQPRFLIIVRPSLKDALVKTYDLDGAISSLGDAAGFFPGSGGAEARAAAVVHIDVQLLENRDEVISKLAGLPHLL